MHLYVDFTITTLVLIISALFGFGSMPSRHSIETASKGDVRRSAPFRLHHIREWQAVARGAGFGVAISAGCTGAIWFLNEKFVRADVAPTVIALTICLLIWALAVVKTRKLRRAYQLA